MAKTDTNADSKRLFHVYLLLKTPVTGPTRGSFDLGNVLYAGKGKGHRWQDHFEAALADSTGAKSDAIRATIGSDPSPEVIERHANGSSPSSVGFGPSATPTSLGTVGTTPTNCPTTSVAGRSGSVSTATTRTPAGS